MLKMSCFFVSEDVARSEEYTAFKSTVAVCSASRSGTSVASSGVCEPATLVSDGRPLMSTGIASNHSSVS